ncbi:mucin-binding protein [Lactococcus carnosus]|uniref:DUF5011 domain-containing protein n=1 Tax=Pseudolactococcus carnosus TaxID=2749961 RepID=A0ABT0AQY5_9LACT|nr:bacterial Ig-like domain-containing protein [Lactococcus carnosus]MCJ1989110.1 DUF5011 domain-containing protein [Lactococcus carnosus]
MTKQNNFRTWKKGKSWLFSASALAILALGSGGIAILANQTPVSAKAVNMTDASGNKVSELTSGVTATTGLPKGVRSIKFGLSSPDNTEVMYNLKTTDFAQFLDIDDIQFTTPMTAGQKITIPVTASEKVDNGEEKTAVFNFKNTSVPKTFVTADGSASIYVSRTAIVITANKDGVSEISGVKNIKLSVVHTMSELGTTVQDNVPTKKWKITYNYGIGDATSVATYSQDSSNYKDLADVKANYELTRYNHFANSIAGLAPVKTGQTYTSTGEAYNMTNGGINTRYYISGSNMTATDDIAGTAIDTAKVFDGGTTTYTITPVDNMSLSDAFKALDYTKKETLIDYIAKNMEQPLADQIPWPISYIEQSENVDFVNAVKSIIADASVSKDGKITIKIFRDKSKWENLTKIQNKVILEKASYAGTPQLAHLKEVIKSTGTKYFAAQSLNLRSFYRLVDPSQDGNNTLKIDDGKGTTNLINSDTLAMSAQGKADATMAGIYSKFGFINSKGSWIDLATKPSKTDYYHDGDVYNYDPPLYITEDKVQYKLMGIDTKTSTTLLDPNNKFGNISASGTINSSQYGKVYRAFFEYAIQKPARYNVVYRDVDDKAPIKDDTLSSQYVEGAMQSQYDNSKQYDATLRTLQAKGYKLKNQDAEALKGTFDKDTATFYVNMVHDTSDKDGVSKDVKQTIKYVTKDGKHLTDKGTGKDLPDSADNVQIMHFTSVDTVDKVSGKVIKTVWNDPQKAKAVATPKFAGYKATSIKGADNNPNSSVTNVTEGTYLHTTKDEVITITYDEIPSRATVTYIDTDVNASTPDDVVTKQIVNGLQGQNYDNSKAYDDVMAKLKAKGYELVKAEAGATKGTFITDKVTNPDEYYVYLKHGTTAKDGQKKDVTQTIKYVDEAGKTLTDGTGKQILPDNVQTVHFFEHNVIDNVTGKTIKSNWNDAQKTKAVATPKAVGYQATSIAGADNNPNSTATNVTEGTYKHDSANEVVTITFKAQSARVNIIFRDVDKLAPSDNATLSAIYVDGKDGQVYDNSSNYAKQLDSLKSKGYVFVKSDKGFDKGTFNGKDATLYVDMKHDTKTVAKDKHVTQTINYVDVSGKAMPNVKPVVESLKFTDKQTVDSVTGQVISDAWSNEQTTKTVKSPEIKGYTADIKEVKATTYKHDSKDTTLTVKYTADTVKPDIAKLTVKNLELKTGAKYSAKDGFVSLYDGSGKVIDFSKVTITGADKVDTAKAGTYKVNYSYQLSKTNTLTATSIVTVGTPTKVTEIKESLKGTNLPTELSISAHDTTLTVGDEFKPEALFDSATDGSKAIEFKDIKVVGIVDTAKIGAYNLTYTYVDADGRSTSVIVSVTVKTALLPAEIKAKDSTLFVGDTWKAEDNFVSGKDEHGNVMNFKSVVAEGKADTTKAGVYKVSYTYTDEAGKEVKAVATITVKAFQSKEVKQTINYVDADGKEVAKSDTQTLIFSEHPSDKENAWDAKAQTTIVKSPEVKGYTADKAQVDEQTYTRDSKDVTITVTYKEAPSAAATTAEKIADAILPHTGEDAWKKGSLLGFLILGVVAFFKRNSILAFVNKLKK